jgi:hypothetical protein
MMRMSEEGEEEEGKHRRKRPEIMASVVSNL